MNSSFSKRRHTQPSDDVLIAESEQRGEPALREALKVLARAEEFRASTGSTGNLIGVLVLKAIALQALGDEAGALGALQRALLHGEPEGYVRTFIDEGAPMGRLLRKAQASGIYPAYAARLLVALENEPAMGMTPPEEVDIPPAVEGPQPLAEPLTDRELDVLRLLPTSLAAAEIAGELVVAPSTVRTHIKSIYSKLEVHRRMEAVARARELGLL